MRFVFIFMFLIKFAVANCQDLFNSTTNTLNTPTLEAYDISGKPIPTSANAAIDGSAMLNEQFVKGVVKFKNGQQYKDVQLNLSLTTNELYFKNDSVTLTFLYPVYEFMLLPESKNSDRIMYFKNGFPRIKANSEKVFYQVLSNGSKACLLKYLYKTPEEHYEYGGPIKKEYILKENYYIYDVINGQMSEINLNSNAIKKSLPAAYAKFVEQYASNNKVNLKKEENVKSLMDYINEQPED